MRILVSICTRGRYENYLPMALESVIMQTRKPDHVTIFDDNEVTKDIRTIPAHNYLLTLMNQKGIEWNYVYGHKKGQHFNDEMANTSGYDLVWRFDDDELAEPNCLEEMEKCMNDDVGAVGCLVIQPPAQPLPKNADNKIDDMNLPNLQWFEWDGQPKEVEHLHSSFLYRAGLEHFDLRLSQVSFRGETMFSHSLFRRGLKLLVNPKAKVWHLQSDTGGCRTEIEEQKRNAMYNYDECIFRDWLAFQKKNKKLFVLNNGVGDHYMFRQAVEIPKGSVISCCYPEVFKDLDVEIISISDAQKIVQIEDYDIYKWCHENKWGGTMIGAFKHLYEDIIR